MEQTSKIILRRKNEWMNRMRRYRVLINDAEAGKISNEQTEEYITEPGLKLVQCRVDWCGSPKKELMLKPGENAYLVVQSNLKYINYIYIAVLVGLFADFILRKSGVVFPKWVHLLFAVLLVAGFLYMVYYLTIGRNSYLKIAEDKENIFAK
ncbi:MAG: hypothetical protein JSU03_08090 [Bacteroidetes bacterium]|nr:hypothetical protein [Bacteroidota bacterium]MBS1757222.1 hypothetical protein [Bacteroidota bacterium]